MGEAGMDQKDDLLDKTVAEIQEAILNEARSIYSEKVIEHFLHHRNLGPMIDADGSASVKGPCGDTMDLSLRVTDWRIDEARFMTDGCASTIACGSIITELVKGKTIVEALNVSAGTVLDALGGLPASSVHCSVLAAQALRESISNVLSSKKEKNRRNGS